MYIHDISTSNPPHKVSQLRAAEEFKKKVNSNAAQRMIDAAAVHSGIENRFVIISDADERPTDKFYSTGKDEINPDTRTRMAQYENWSKVLAKQAVGKLLERNNIDTSRIRRLITISCTGFYAPGVDHYLINEFNLSPDIRKINIGFMGCAAAITGFNSVMETAVKDDDNSSYTLLIALEICSLHLHTVATRDNILATMIFADGCGAVLFSNLKKNNNETQLKLISTDSYIFDNTEKYMGWKVGNYGFDLVLSSDIPKIILDGAIPQLKKILSSKGLNIDSIKHWVLHPGGRAILDALQTGLQLSDKMMEPSRHVLKNYGNMSSASILFVLREVLDTREIKKDELCCAVAFGPGLIMETAIFKGM